MKYDRVCLMALALLAVLFFALPAFAEAGETTAEWTVMFYFCGSDLESRHGYATGNLEEIAGCDTYDVLHHIYRGDEDKMTTVGAVNVVLETGGCKRWHAQSLGMDVDPTVLQRWVYRPTPRNWIEDGGTFVLADTQPLASMAIAQTLSDFIRWAAENYPAKKYALVLWDHGGGSKTGIFIDELFGGDILYLDELHRAMTDGGVSFETVLFDACMMANIETACAVKDNARWMVASEEVVAGKGTAMGDWLQQLYITPDWDGERLGRWICDMTEIKYARENDEQAQSLLTWSVIDLSRIDHLVADFDLLFKACCEAYVDDPDLLSILIWAFRQSEEYGSGNHNMFDLSNIFYRNEVAIKMDPELYRDILDTLTDAVVYCTRGAGRNAARGLSFCYATDFDASELDTYAHNCPSAHYLAFLDAINPLWTAPDWVYETAPRLPDIKDLDSYRITVSKRISSNGTPGVYMEYGWRNIEHIYVELYRKNPETGDYARLGKTITFSDGDAINIPYRFWLWPAIDGVHCDAEIVRYDTTRGQYLINIPVRINGENGLIRCGYSDENAGYTAFGLWDGYDIDSDVFQRNVLSLAQVAGQEYTLLYPIKDSDDGGGKTLYEASEPMTMYRALDIVETPLPAGDYLLEYKARDIFMRSLPVGRVLVHWDGEKLSLPEDAAWEGTIDLVRQDE